MSAMDCEPLGQMLINELSRVIDRYRNNGITYDRAIGALEILKLDIYMEAKRVAEGDENENPF